MLRKFSAAAVLALVLCFVVLAPLFALAQATQPDPGSLLGMLVSAIQGHNWSIVVGIILSGITYAVRTWALPNWTFAQTNRGGAVLALAVAVVGTVGAELLAGTTSWNTIIDAVAAALSSAGFYSLLRKIVWPNDPVVGGSAAKPASPK